MKTTYEYIHFVEQHPSKHRVFICSYIITGIELGYIKWHPAHKEYRLDLIITIKSTYSEGTLRDIADFINQLMNERKAKPPKAPENVVSSNPFSPSMFAPE